MKHVLVLLCILHFVCFALSSRAQRVSRWDVCEDTVTMRFDMPRMLAAASPSDIAQIGIPVWANDSPRVVRHSIDSGRTWTTIFKKSEGWDNWSILRHPSANLYVVGADTDDLLAIDTFGYDENRVRAYLLVSNDSGATWRQQYFDTNTYVSDIAMLNATYGVAILWHYGNIYNVLPSSQPDDLLITTDGWKSWTSHPIPQIMKYSQHLVCFGVGVFAASTYVPTNGTTDSTVYIETTDEGITWQWRGKMPYISDLCFVNERLGWGVGTDYTRQTPLIIQTSDGGTTWHTQLDTNPPFFRWYVPLEQIAFADSLHGFTAGGNLLETSDGGKTWIKNQPPFDLWERPNPGSSVMGLIMPSASCALATSGASTIRFNGGQRLATPVFDMPFTTLVPILPTTVSWSRIAGATSYHLQLAGESQSLPPWQKIFDVLKCDTSLQDTFYTFVPRMAEEYFGRVRALSGSDSSDWRWSGNWFEPIALFQTVGKAGARVPPTILSPITGSHISSGVTIVWSSVPHAVVYHARGWMQGMFPRDSITTTDTFATFSDLIPNESYYFIVKAILPDGVTDWSNGVWVTVDAAALSSDNVPQVVQAFPNPARDVIHFMLPEAIRNSEFKLYDLLGHAFALDPIREPTGVCIDIHSLPNGLYTLMMRGSNPLSVRIMVQH